MYCIGTIKQLKYGYFWIQAVFITPRPSLFPSAPPLEINLGSEMETAYIPHNHTLTVYCYIIIQCIIPILTLTFDGNPLRSTCNCLENDGSREPLEKSKKLFWVFILFWSLAIGNEMCCLNIYGVKGAPC